jgi:hypothetical protein
MMIQYKPYRVVCSAKGCARADEYKIAAQWTDGALVELKPYGFACSEHLAEAYRAAKEKRTRCRLSVGESLGPVGIYRFRPGASDQQIERLTELEVEQEQSLEKTARELKPDP